MDYITILIIAFSVLGGVFGLLTIHFIFFSFMGLFVNKKFPISEEKLKYAVIIGARNEERVIGQLIDSIHANDYPQDKIEIFICAHNCDDRTAEIARSKGAIVVEYNNPDERTLGFAYRALFKNLKEQGYDLSKFDGLLVMNADNIMTENYISKMNDAYVANGKDRVIISYRNSKNFGSNYMSCLYGLFFIAACRFESRGRTFFDCSSRISGTGYLYNPKIIANGWNYVTLTEDWEFTADQVAEGNKIIYCDDAVFYDEQPTTIKVMWTQRLRWARGHTIVFFTRFKKCIKALFSKESKNKGSIFDISVCITPLGVLGLSFGLIELILVALAPVFGQSSDEAWRLFGIYSLIFTAIGYVLTMFSAILLLIVERRRIPKVKFYKMFSAIILWPLFLGIAVIQDVISLFVKKLEWKTIPHTGEVNK